MTLSSLIARVEGQGGFEGAVTHLAHILEEWDMKPPPDACSGHDYNDVARDALKRLAATPDAILVREALEKAFALIDSIRQTRNNVWWVDVDDPETAVCDTYSDIESALARISTGGE